MKHWPVYWIYCKTLAGMYFIHFYWLFLLYHESGKRRLMCLDIGGDIEKVASLYTLEKEHMKRSLKEAKERVDENHRRALTILDHLEKDF